MSTSADKRGHKRICTNCGIKFYDMCKRPINCPECDSEYTGEMKIRGRQVKSGIANDDNKTPAETKKKEAKAEKVEENIEKDDSTENSEDKEELKADKSVEELAEAELSDTPDDDDDDIDLEIDMDIDFDMDLDDLDMDLESDVDDDDDDITKVIKPSVDDDD
jgi:hypothetical protein